MTVGELVAALQALDPTLPVVAHDEYRFRFVRRAERLRLEDSCGYLTEEWPETDAGFNAVTLATD